MQYTAAQRLTPSPSGRLWYVPKDLFRFPSLNPPHKLLFLAIWNRGGARPGRQAATTSQLADAILEDERRVREWLWGSRRRSSCLAEVGLVEVLSHERKGQILLEVHDPGQVAADHARVGRVLKPDPQLLLFDFEPDSSAVMRRPSIEEAHIHLHSPMEFIAMETTSIGGDAPQSGAALRPQCGVTPERPSHVSEALAGALARFGQTGDPAKNEAALVKRIMSEVNDPNWDDWCPRQAARLVVDGTVPMADLIHLLGDVHAIRTTKGFTTGPGAFFRSKVRKWPGWPAQDRAKK